MGVSEVHRVAAAALVRDGRVLLGHRHPARAAYPDCWDLVGGHVEPGESSLDALRRECLEELGVVVEDPRPVWIRSTDPALELHAFVVTTWSGEVRNAAPEEHDDLRWFDPDEVAGLTVTDPAGLADLLAAVAGATRPAAAGEGGAG